MARVPKKVADRFATTVGAFQRVLADAKDRDVNESDTVTIITDILSDVLGYNKYSDITSEQAIRGTYCDLAVKHDGKVQFLSRVRLCQTGCSHCMSCHEEPVSAGCVSPTQA